MCRAFSNLSLLPARCERWFLDILSGINLSWHAPVQGSPDCTNFSLWSVWIVEMPQGFMRLKKPDQVFITYCSVESTVHCTVTDLLEIWVVIIIVVRAQKQYFQNDSMVLIATWFVSFNSDQQESTGTRTAEFPRRWNHHFALLEKNCKRAHNQSHTGDGRCYQ